MSNNSMKLERKIELMERYDFRAQAGRPEEYGFGHAVLGVLSVVNFIEHR